MTSRYPGGNQPLNRDQQELVISHLNLARHYVRNKFKARGQELEDYDQAAFLGLIQAAQRFDPSKGVPFWGYARAWVFKNVAEYMGKDETIKPSWDIIRSDKKPEVSADIPLESSNPDLLGLLGTMGDMEEGYEAVEDRDFFDWVRRVMSKYDDEIVSYWWNWTQGNDNWDWTPEEQKLVLALDEELRKGI